MELASKERFTQILKTRILFTSYEVKRLVILKLVLIKIWISLPLYECIYIKFNNHFSWKYGYGRWRINPARNSSGKNPGSGKKFCVLRQNFNFKLCQSCRGQLAPFFLAPGHNFHSVKLNFLIIVINKICAIKDCYWRYFSLRTFVCITF